MPSVGVSYIAALCTVPIKNCKYCIYIYLLKLLYFSFECVITVDLATLGLN